MTGENTRDQFAGLGFAVGSVHGTRSFRVTESGFLRGYVYNTTWLPGVNIASCMRRGWGCGYMPDAGGQHRHSSLCYSAEPCGTRSPGSSCKCGFYGYYDGSLDYAAANTVSGVIEGFGKVSIGTRGFRCEKARIVALTIPADVPAPLAQRVRHNYRDVPFFDTFEAMVREVPTDVQQGPTPESTPDFWTLP